MSTERSDALHKSWRESAEKFDYFMLGILGALCAYLSQGYKPDRIGLNPGTVELFALLVLVIAAVLGFRRIEATNQATIINQRVLHANERRGVLSAIMHNGPKLNVQTGQTYSPEYAASQMPVLNSQIRGLEAQLERAEGKALVFYRGRNLLTLVGFMLLLAGKIFSAYA
jgi:hypothetical protein